MALDALTVTQCMKDAHKAFENGYISIQVTHDDGSKKIYRFFRSNGNLCVFKHQSRTQGYQLTFQFCHTWRSVHVYHRSKLDETYLHWFIKNLRKSKKVFTVEVHPNLWQDMQAIYARLDIEGFEQFVRDLDINENSRADTMEAFKQYADTCGIEGVLYGHYKRSTIQGNAPFQYSNRGTYDECIKNISGHIERKEDFSYYWYGRYDSSVQGSTSEDGIYRAWLSHEYRNKGNGHYYALINDNSAILLEDD